MSFLLSRMHDEKGLLHQSALRVEEMRPSYTLCAPHSARRLVIKGIDVMARAQSPQEPEIGKRGLCGRRPGALGSPELVGLQSPTISHKQGSTDL